LSALKLCGVFGWLYDQLFTLTLVERTTTGDVTTEVEKVPWSLVGIAFVGLFGGAVTLVTWYVTHQLKTREEKRAKYQFDLDVLEQRFIDAQDRIVATKDSSDKPTKVAGLNTILDLALTELPRTDLEESHKYFDRYPFLQRALTRFDATLMYEPDGEILEELKVVTERVCEKLKQEADQEALHTWIRMLARSNRRLFARAKTARFIESRDLDTNAREVQAESDPSWKRIGFRPEDVDHDYFYKKLRDKYKVGGQRSFLETSNEFNVRFADQLLRLDTCIEMIQQGLGARGDEATFRLDLSDTSLTAIQLDFANLQCCWFMRCDLADANLASANLLGAALEEASLDRVNMEGANFQGASLYKTTFLGSRCRDAKFTTLHFNYYAPALGYSETDVRAECTIFYDSEGFLIRALDDQDYSRRVLKFRREQVEWPDTDHVLPDYQWKPISKNATETSQNPSGL